MSTSTITPPGRITRYWKTGVIIGRVDLADIVSVDLAADCPSDGGRCRSLHADAVPGFRALEEQFLAAMTDLATADGAPVVTQVSVDVQVWQNGYDSPAFACQARYVGWVILAASEAPQHSESGCLAFADPRAGSALTAMPGLPFGRQFLLRPVPGARAIVPGWLTSSVVPLEAGQCITVAVATGD
jgi:hypothetical protein